MKFHPILAFFTLSLANLTLADEGVAKVSATKDSIVIEGILNHPGEVGEVQPYDADGPGLRVGHADTGKFYVTLPRFDGERDRLYSAFTVARAGKLMGTPRFVEEMKGVAALDEPYPVVSSKKGLQVADVADALALGIKHAALNVWLNSYIDLEHRPDGIDFPMDGKTFRFRRGSVDGLDRQIKTLSDAGVVVSLILLYHRSGDAAQDKLMLHPTFDENAPNGLSAFNVSTPEATEELKACFEFLGERYARPDRAHGRAVNFIVGNEVDSHWYWYNLGHADAATVADNYARAVRLCHTAVRKYNSTSRVFLSLDHMWNMRYPDKDPKQDCRGRELVEDLHALIASHGDIDWDIAFHPYPESLFEPRFWHDKTATFRDDTPRITFKNIEMLPKYLSQPAMEFHGQPRHVILSEQGFHTPKGPDGETIQAAAYACAYYRIDHIPGIDAFILHRHIDAAQEGGLHLGLWWAPDTNPNSKTREKKKIYEVFRAAGTDDWKRAFEFALPVIGIKSWDEANPHL